MKKDVCAELEQEAQRKKSVGKWLKERKAKNVSNDTKKIKGGKRDDTVAT